MPVYDFSTLSPCDFEELSRDLLQEELRITLESFKTGRDQGIDLRYSKGDGKLVIQCKHYLGSGYAKLKYVLQNDELPKIARLKPDRYILTTSVGLSPSNKDELLSLLQPHCRSTEDILGQGDLNNLIGKFPLVERKHFKLWLPSVTVLQRLLNNRVFAESAVAIDEIQRQLSLFVPSDAVQRGLSLIDQHGYCLLTGIPGIGKTTTARILIAHHIEQDWEAFCVTSDIGAAFDVFTPEDKQIFLYDDFLGQTSLAEKFVKNEDQQLLNLVHACQKTPATKRLVLTTRDHLFAQALQEHERLAKSNLSLSECAIALVDYTKPIRAKILVNHLYVYGVASEVCTEFVESGVAKATINHENYNPRIVESVCELQVSDPDNAADFGSHFLRMLEDPQEIWRHAYSRQLSESARQLLLLFAVLGNHALVSALQDSFEAYCIHKGSTLVGIRDRFRGALRELEGNFIAITPLGGTTFITYHNPSIKDFTDRQLAEEPYFLRDVLNSCPFDKPLLEAARLLMQARPVQVTAQELLAAVNRSDCETATRMIQLRSGEYYRYPHDLAESLLLWLRWICELSTPGDDTQNSILRKVETFLQSGNYSCQRLDDLTTLYSEFAVIAKGNSAASISPLDFVATYKDVCRNPKDFVAFRELVEGFEGSEPVQAELRRLFCDVVCEWLDQSIDRSDSSEEAFSAIAQATDAAASLGLDPDLQVYQDRAEVLSEREEHEADQRRDEFEEYRFDNQDQESEVDDILDSMKS